MTFWWWIWSLSYFSESVLSNIFIYFKLSMLLHIVMGISARTSGTTVTFVIIEGWVVTVASVGDSRCILEPAEGGIYYLSADHRLECNEEE